LGVYATRIVIAIINSEYLTQVFKLVSQIIFLSDSSLVNLSDMSVLPYVDLYKACLIHGENNSNGEALAISLT